MAFIQSDGIVFGNTTSLASKYGIIDQNSVQIFYQASAPTGWTQVTHHDAPLNTQSIDNKALRVVSGLGGLFAGLDSFTTVFPFDVQAINDNATLSGTVGDTTLTLDQLPIHAHGAGSSFNNFVSSPSASPFRQELRSPIAYSFRSAYRQPRNQRVLVNFRQPVVARQPRFYRQPRNYRVPVNNQQPRTFRRPYLASFRRPYNALVPFRQPRSYQRPYSFRRPYNRSTWVNFQQPRQYFRPGGGWRRPVGGWFGSYRRPYGGGGGYWINRRRPSSGLQPSNWQRPASYSRPINSRSPSSFWQPRRQPVNFNNQQPNNFRRPYAFRQPRSGRAVVNFRASVNQRNPASYRQPRTYRVVTRYPVVNNVRYSTRTLVPGGAIRDSDQNGPSTSLVGGGGAHDHSFVGDSVPISASIDLRLQYIDVIVCQFD